MRAAQRDLSLRRRISETRKLAEILAADVVGLVGLLTPTRSRLCRDAERAIKAIKVAERTGGQQGSLARQDCTSQINVCLLLNII